MKDVKKFLLFGCAGLLVFGFFGFVLLIAVLWQVADDAEDEKRSRVTIIVRHRLYDDGSLPLGHQCLSHAVLITEQAWEVSADGKQARQGEYSYKAIERGGSPANFDSIEGVAQHGWPQPLGRVPAISEPMEHEFKVDAPKTYYYLVEVSGHECAGGTFAPPDAIGFKTGQFSIAANEAKRIEVDFTKP